MQHVIYLAFVDDWEVRGNGTGNPRTLQFEPMRELVKIFNNHGIRGSFNVEVMQQLTYRSLQGRFPELQAIADEWERVVKESFQQGHDIQLHLHPQWSDARYNREGDWMLSGDWSIINYRNDQIRAMLVAGKQYLESLLREIDPAYTCVSFRAGSWCAAPSDYLLPALSELGFVFDMSIVAGIRYDTPRVKLDYSRCEEPFLPYYPQMRDARQLSRSVQPIVCIPTNSLRGIRATLFRRDVGKAGMALRDKVRKLKQRNSTAQQEGSRGRSGKDWVNMDETGVFGIARRMLRRYMVGQAVISDLSQMNYAMMSRMMENIDRRAARSGLAHIPVILENHTKDVSDFSDITRFIKDIVARPNVKTVTLTEIAYGIRDGTFRIRTA